MLRRAQDHSLNSFVESDADTRLVLYISWGMMERDLSGCHFSTPACRGSQVWDSNFNPSTPEAQTAMKVFTTITLKPIFLGGRGVGRCYLILWYLAYVYSN